MIVYDSFVFLIFVYSISFSVYVVFVLCSFRVVSDIFFYLCYFSLVCSLRFFPLRFFKFLICF